MVSMLTLRPRGLGLNSHPNLGLNVLEKTDHFPVLKKIKVHRKKCIVGIVEIYQVYS